MLNWNKMSLKNQFLFLFIIVQIAILFLSYIYFTSNFSEFYLDKIRLNLEHKSSLILSNDQLYSSFDETGKLDQWIKKLGREVDTRITIIRPDGIVLADSAFDPRKMDNHAGRKEIKAVLTGSAKGNAIRYSSTLDMDMFYLASPIEQEGRIIGVIRLAESLQDIQGEIRRNVRNYLLFFVVLVLATSFLAWRFSDAITGPLSKLTRVAGKIADGDLKERIQLKSYENEIGEMAGMFNYMADQLEKKIAEIIAEKSKAEAILSSMVDGVIAVDKERRVITINPAAKKMLSLNDQDIKTGKDFIELIRHHKIDDLLQIVLEEGRVISEEIVLQKEEKKILSCHLAPIINNNNQETRGGVIVFTDVTELRKLEQVRKDFVANVSHELRTPLTSIIGYLDTILENRVKDENVKNRFLKIIKDEADRLALLIRDLLDLSRLEGKDYKDHLAPYKLQPVINKVLVMLQEKAIKKNIKLMVDLKSDLPLVLMIPEQIEQVLINLIDNAIKYTPEGGQVTVRTRDEKDRVMVEVEDNGIGIPSEDQERIFERFYRVDKARSRALGGTGIGLSIVKHILLGHNSEIEVESEEDQGSIFRFYLKKAI